MNRLVLFLFRTTDPHLNDKIEKCRIAYLFLVSGQVLWIDVVRFDSISSNEGIDKVHVYKIWVDDRSFLNFFHGFFGLKIIQYFFYEGFGSKLFL